ncbi:hypothetical protein Taro_016206 [Colocasia esculenta]|uniref:SPT2 chromatin protein n=1 Tax=Colocasia esculenta TaxID=4460 RepID=A0A843UN71_COLES|nr:hypothetical protein [Colocasia esculenta]
MLVNFFILNPLFLPNDFKASRQTYDDYDEYEEDEEDQEDEEKQEEEEEKPSKEVLDYLKLREKFKERIRQKIKKENAAVAAPSHSTAKNGTTTDTKFGSFFGPSQRGKHVSSNAEMKFRSNEKPRKVVNEAGRSSVSHKMSMSTKPAKQIPESHLSRNAISRDQHVKKKVEYQKAIPSSRPKSSSSEPRKLQGEHQKTILPSRPKAYSSDPRQLQAKHQKTIPPSRPQASFSEPKRILGGHSGGVHRQPMVAKTSSLNTVTRKTPVVGGTKPSNMERAHLITKSQSSGQKNYSQQRREIPDMSKGKLVPKQMMPSSKPQLSKPPKQIQQRTTHEDIPKQKTLKRFSRNPFDDDDDDIDDPLSFLRNNLLSKYNSAKYQVDDDDDSDMEANFDDIMKEEQRSSRIARQEDEEELRLIEEEERRERMRKEAKRRKLQRYHYADAARFRVHWRDESGRMDPYGPNQI